jgi:hypothetical protein
MNNPDGNFDFAGIGFTLLSLDVGTISDGTLLGGSLSQPLGSVTFDNATGAISFSAAKSPAGVEDIAFAGNAIADDSGNVIGFTGTWQGVRVPIIVEELATVAAHRGRVEREKPALGITRPPFFDASGSWAAVADHAIFE